MSEEHVPLERLAADTAGLLSTDESRQVRAHAAECERCQANRALLTEVDAALAELPSPVMPPEVAQRIDTALRAAARSPHDVVPLDPVRRARSRARLAGFAAMAAGVALIGALIAAHVVGGGGASSGGATDAAGSTTSASTTITAGAVAHLRAVEHDLKSGYTARTLPGQISAQLRSGTIAPSATQANGGGQSAAPSATADHSTAGQKTAGRMAPFDSAAGSRSDALAALRNPTRMFACIAQLTTEPQVTIPLAVNFSSFAGKPAVVIVVPDRYNRQQATAYVAGARCGLPGSDGDLIHYQGAIPR